MTRRAPTFVCFKSLTGTSSFNERTYITVNGTEREWTFIVVGVGNEEMLDFCKLKVATYEFQNDEQTCDFSPLSITQHSHCHSSFRRIPPCVVRRRLRRSRRSGHTFSHSNNDRSSWFLQYHSSRVGS